MTEEKILKEIQRMRQSMRRRIGKTVYNENVVAVHTFYEKKVYDKMRLKWLKSQENLKKLSRLNFQY